MLAAAVVATGSPWASAVVPPGQPAKPHSWIATGWNIHLLNGISPATARHFFSTPISYGTGTDLASSPVLDGFAAQPTLWYTSYQKFAADLKSGAIKYPYRWVFYDPEHWAPTPVAEQNNPGTYLRLFGQLAHAHGYKVIASPARDLGLAPKPACPFQHGWTLNSWYVNCHIPAMAAQYSDVLVVQDQRNLQTLSVYDSLFNSARAQALAANSHVVVTAGLSTNIGTPAQMAAAAKSVTAGGYYVTIRSRTISQFAQFLKDMQAAGY